MKNITHPYCLLFLSSGSSVGLLLDIDLTLEKYFFSIQSKQNFHYNYTKIYYY